MNTAAFVDRVDAELKRLGVIGHAMLSLDSERCGFGVGIELPDSRRPRGEWYRNARMISHWSGWSPEQLAAAFAAAIVATGGVHPRYP